MRLKKIAIVALTALMIITSMPLATAKAASETTDIQFLVEMGIMKRSMLSKGENPLTRAEAAQILSGFCIKLPVDGIGFQDVGTDHIAYDSIMQVVANGFMNGFSQTEFMPDELISATEFRTAVVRMLGYGKVAEFRGGFPIGYEAVGNQIGLPRISGDTITAETAADVLTEALEIPVLEQTVSGRNSYLETVDSQTLSYVKFGMVKIEGVVCSSPYTALNGMEEAEEGKFYIDDVLISTGTDVNEYFGMYVEAYALETDDKEYDLVAIRSKQQKNTVVQIESDDILKYSKNVYTVWNEAKEKNVNYSVSYGAEIIYNGRVWNGYSDSDLSPAMGNVTLISNDGDSTFDVVIINSLTVDTVKSLNDDMLITKTGECFELDDFEYINVIDNEGDILSVYELSKDDVICWGVSADKECLTVLLSKEKVSGKISKIQNGNGEVSVTIAGEKYEILKNTWAAEELLRVEIGANVTLHLDYAGRGVKFDLTNSDAYFYGWLAAVGSKSGMLGGTVVKTFDSDGEIREIKLAQKLKLDGDSVEADKQIYQLKIRQSLVNNARLVYNPFDTVSSVADPDSVTEFGMLIRYKLNGDGEIGVIDTAAPYMTDSDNPSMLHFSKNAMGRYPRKGAAKIKAFVEGSNEWDSASKTGKYSRLFYDGETMLFNIPDDIKNHSSEFNMDVNWQKFQDDSKLYEVEAYYTDDEMYADAIIYHIPTGNNVEVYDYNKPMVVTEVGTAMNENGEIVRCFTGYYNGSTDVTVTEKEMDCFGDVSPGDVIQYTVRNGFGVKAQMRYDYSKDSTVGTSSYRAWPHVVKGYVYGKEDSFIYTVEKEADLKNAESFKEIYNTSVFPIVVYDADRSYVERATFDDIVDYTSSENGYSKFVVLMRDLEPLLLVIYNNWK